MVGCPWLAAWRLLRAAHGDRSGSPLTCMEHTALGLVDKAAARRRRAKRVQAGLPGGALRRSTHGADFTPLPPPLAALQSILRPFEAVLGAQAALVQAGRGRAAATMDNASATLQEFTKNSIRCVGRCHRRGREGPGGAPAVDRRALSAAGPAPPPARAPAGWSSGARSRIG